MNYRNIARLIPDAVRHERLMNVADPIANAIPVAADQNMVMLMKIWFKYIEPNQDADYGCPACMNRVRNNFREMKDALIELEKEFLLLKSLDNGV